MRKKVKLNIKFQKNIVLCAKSPEFCIDCKEKQTCEHIEMFYNPYSNKDILECFNNSEKRR